VENNSSTSHFKEPALPSRRAVNTRALWLLPIGILLVEAALRFMPAGFMIRTIRLRMSEIETLPAPRIQVMGDSVTAAIHVSSFASAAHIPADSVANYSLPGTSPVFAYFTLRRELAAGRLPGAILYAPHPANLESPMIDRFIGRFATARESVSLLQHGVTLPEWLFGAACRASIAMRNREEFRLAATQGDFGFFQTLRKPAVSVSVSREPVVHPAAPPPPLAVSPADFPAQLNTPFFVDPVNATYIDAFLDLAAQHHIPVVWVTLPVIGLFKDRAMSDGGEAKYQSWLDSLAARHSNLTFLHRQIEVYPDNCFADPWHLNSYGAARFSSALGATFAASTIPQPPLARPAEHATGSPANRLP
jgi:hypothetical protein